MLIGEQDYGNFTKGQHFIFRQKAWNINVDLFTDSSKLTNMWKQSMIYVHTIEITARPRISSAGFSSRLKEDKKWKSAICTKNNTSPVEIAVHDYNSWLSVWTRSIVVPLSFLRSYQQCLSDRLQILRIPAAFSFPVPLHSTLFLFYKNVFYKNIEAEILRIF